MMTLQTVTSPTYMGMSMNANGMAYAQPASTKCSFVRVDSTHKAWFGVAEVCVSQLTSQSSTSS